MLDFNVYFENLVSKAHKLAFIIDDEITYKRLK